ncbi:MAG: FkbM family methyltransferase [Anaerolineales bacterium]|nr:FkbM family methyltransferase [Anaerolineales bacterium]
MSTLKTLLPAPLRRRLGAFRKGLEVARFRWETRHLDAFLRDVRGVIHVGAHTGEEADLYAARGLDVIWLEPIPAVFAQLEKNIAPFPRQRAIRALISSADDQPITFHVADNAGSSSSLFEFARHTELYGEVAMGQTLTLQTVTLSTLAQREQIDLSKYDALVMDTQASELLVLQGAAPILDGFRYIKTEAADFELYKGGCQLKDIEAFLSPRGYREIARYLYIEKADVGHCYDVVYRRGT